MDYFNALVRIHKYHILIDLQESYLRNSEFYLQIFIKTPGQRWNKDHET
jgi:hypothetical protein